MKKIINYGHSDLQMGDLLKENGVNISKDFSAFEKKILANTLERYMTSGCADLLKLDLKSFYLLIKGADEASYLYQYVID